MSTECTIDRETLRCVVCGSKFQRHDVLANCQGKSSPGLGDMVKAGLSAIGITEERVSAAIGRPCGCSERAEKLNELGRKIGIG